MGPLFSHAKWTCELAIKWTQRQKSTGKSPHFSGSTVHGPRPHFIDTRGTGVIGSEETRILTVVKS